MKMGLIGCGFSELGFEMDYKGPFMNALIRRLNGIVREFKPDEILTPANPGAEIIWAWVAMGKKIPITCVLTNPDYGKYLEHRNKQNLENLKRLSKVIYVGSVSNVATEKYRDDYIISRSDTIIVVWNKRTDTRIHKAMMQIEQKDREIILIDTNAINT